MPWRHQNLYRSIWKILSIFKKKWSRSFVLRILREHFLFSKETTNYKSDWALHPHKFSTQNYKLHKIASGTEERNEKKLYNWYIYLQNLAGRPRRSGRQGDGVQIETICESGVKSRGVQVESGESSTTDEQRREIGLGGGMTGRRMGMFSY